MQGLRLNAAMAASLAALSLSACNNTSFNSETPKKSADIQVRKPEKKTSDTTLKLACENGEGDARLVTELEGSEATTVRLEGEFCGIPAGAATGRLTVLFVLDFSGSMKNNDPLVTGRCGRLEAGEAIVRKLEADLQEGLELNVGILPFGTTALPVTGPEPLAAFRSRLTADSFCLNDGGDTNYEAAFASARETFANVEGAKVVYFVSDGLPTQSGTGILTGLGGLAGPDQIYEAGRKAAEALRALPDLTLNTIFLGNGGAVGTGGVEPQTYLEEVTGDKERVRLVTNAGDLAAEIVKFDTPETVTLDKDSVSASVTAKAFGQNDISLRSLEPDPSREGVWTFVTEPFTLFASKSKSVRNEVTLTVRGGDGKDYKATALITFEVVEEE